MKSKAVWVESRASLVNDGHGRGPSRDEWSFSALSGSRPLLPIAAVQRCGRSRPRLWRRADVAPPNRPKVFKRDHKQPCYPFSRCLQYACARRAQASGRRPGNVALVPYVVLVLFRRAVFRPPHSGDRRSPIPQEHPWTSLKASSMPPRPSRRAHAPSKSPKGGQLVVAPGDSPGSQSQ